MLAPNLFAMLVAAGSVLAPALPQRNTGWVGETVLIKRAGVQTARMEADGTFTPVGGVRSIQFVVTREERDRVQVSQEGKPVWIEKTDLVRLKEAVDFYTKELDAEPDNDQWFAMRGWARYRQGQLAEALKDYAEAIRISPQSPNWYSNRGAVLLGSKKYDEAIADFTTALELNPDSEYAIRNRGAAYFRKKEYAKALADYDRATELNPESAVNQNQVAWLLSTASDDKVRDGKRALEAAKKACELTDHKNGGFLDTLAAAYAELGQFDKAVEWQERALKAGDLPIQDRAAARQRLLLYKQKKPYRGDE
jgi:tetratricopeptide (TPR) repeat protein